MSGSDKDRCILVHVPDETHAAASAFCRAHGIDAKWWVSGLILEAVAKATQTIPDEELDEDRGESP